MRLLSLCVLFILTSASLSFAGTLMLEDFESYAPDAWPTTWVKGGSAATDPQNNLVTLDPEDTPNQALKLFAQGNRSAIGYHPATYAESFTVEIDVYNGTERLSGHPPYRAVFGMRHGTHWYEPTNPAFKFVYFLGGSFLGSDYTELMTNVELARWYSFKIKYVRVGDQLTLDYWIDDQFLTTIAETVDLSKHLTLDHFQVSCLEGSAYFDNIHIYASSGGSGPGSGPGGGPGGGPSPVPLPGAGGMGIMLLGALWLAGRRRRSRHDTD